MSTPSDLATAATPMTIPLCVPQLAGQEWRYVKEALDSGWVSSVGPFVERFEEELAEYVGAPHAVATVNGTSALHIALLVAGVEVGDEVLVSTLTFIAPANAVRYAGAWPIFIDAEPTHWQMDPGKVAHFLERKCAWRDGVLRNKETGRRVRAILPVHILGHPADMEPLLELARHYDLRVIEDATEGLGAEYKGGKIGVLGDFGCFSFNGNKLITTGGGGMIVTGNAEAAQRARHLTTQAKTDPIEFIHPEIGYNYRLTNLQAAVGCAQLERIEEHIAAKREIAMRYQATFRDLPGVAVMKEAAWARSVFWMYTIRVDERHFGGSSRALRARLAERGIVSRPLWQPMHVSDAHAQSPRSQCKVADALWNEALSLPCSVGLSAGDQQQVIETILQFHHEQVDRRSSHADLLPRL